MKITLSGTLRRLLLAAGAALPALAYAHAAAAQTLTIESWRNDDADIWNGTIIPAFEKAHPGIKLNFKGLPPTEYNAALNAQLAGGTAADLIACRPFDASLDLYTKGFLAPVDDVPGLDNFPAVARSAWQTDDHKTTFCMPMASVIHGFIYNQSIFDELKLQPPKTMAEFHNVLDAIKKDGHYTPLDMGTADQWEAATMGFQNIGPNYWHGEEGRQALLDGKAKFTDKPYIETWAELASWAPYLGSGYKAQKYADSQNLFELGKAAIYPAGSWDISVFEKDADFKMGAFPPPLPAGETKCYLDDHVDIAMGVNAHSPNQAAAKQFLAWLATPEFATLYGNEVKGFIPLTTAKVDLKDPLVQQFVSWRQTCALTIRNSYQLLSRGTPNLENELWNVTAQVVNHTMTPEQAGEKVEADLKTWYKPHQQ